MMRWSWLPRCAALKSGCANWSGCSAGKTMEVEILKEALELARAKNRSCCRARRFPEIPVKRVIQTLGVARSNVFQPGDGARPGPGPQERHGDVELAAAIRRLVHARPTYGTGGL